MVSKLGNDKFCQSTLENFRVNNVDAQFVFTTPDAPSGVASITVDAHGNNIIVIVPGANDLLTPEEVELARPVIKQAKILLVQLEVLAPTTIAAMKIARQEGVTVVLNPAPAPTTPVPDELYTLADIIIPNETELAVITGMPTSTREEIEGVAEKLIHRVSENRSSNIPPPTVIVTLGSKGSLLVRPGMPHQYIPIPQGKVEVVDTTGAGDCYIGGLAMFLASGNDIATAMRKASYVATMSVQHPGTQTSFPERSQVPQDFF